MRIAIGSDHAGFAYKQKLIAYLEGEGHEVQDCGTHSADSTPYPKWIRPAAESVANGKADRGIVLGGSGNGEAIVANRVKGVRCALCWSEQTAKWGRQHNDANCIAIGERTVDYALAEKIVSIFLSEPFEGGRHVERIEMIDKP